MKNYLITIKIYDGENKYYDFFTLKSPNKRNVELEVEKRLKDSQEFTREQELESIEEINKIEYDVLNKLGVV